MDLIIDFINQIIETTFSTGFSVLVFIYLFSILIWRTSLYIEVRKKKSFTTLMASILDMVCNSLYLNGEVQIRVNFFKLFHGNPKLLKLLYSSTNMKNAVDVDIQFEKWQGCAGMAWGYDSLIVADLSQPIAEIENTWALSKEQIQMTSELKAIICIPIRHPRHSKIVGVVCLDSTEPIAEQFLSAEVTNYVESTATLLSEILYKYSII